MGNQKIYLHGTDGRRDLSITPPDNPVAVIKRAHCKVLNRIVQRNDTGIKIVKEYPYKQINSKSLTDESDCCTA